MIKINRGGTWVTVPTGASIISKTYSELSAMATNGTLVAGQLYRITDYVFTASSSCTTIASGNHAFDLIVLALSTTEIDINATAILHSGDTYFSSCDLSKWEIHYTLDNVNFSGGKGTILWMKDEYGNECPYDFKNVIFAHYISSYYTNGSNIANVDPAAAYGRVGYVGAGSSSAVTFLDTTLASTPTTTYAYTFDTYAVYITPEEAADTSITGTYSQNKISLPTNASIYSSANISIYCAGSHNTISFNMNSVVPVAVIGDNNDVVVFEPNTISGSASAVFIDGDNNIVKGIGITISGDTLSIINSWNVYIANITRSTVPDSYDSEVVNSCNVYTAKIRHSSIRDTTTCHIGSLNYSDVSTSLEISLHSGFTLEKSHIRDTNWLRCSVSSITIPITYSTISNCYDISFIDSGISSNITKDAKIRASTITNVSGLVLDDWCSLSFCKIADCTTIQILGKSSIITYHLPFLVNTEIFGCSTITFYGGVYDSSIRGVSGSSTSIGLSLGFQSASGTWQNYVKKLRCQGVTLSSNLNLGSTYTSTDYTIDMVTDTSGTYKIITYSA